MLGDRVRIGLFRKAIERAVRPGHVVVEIGAGSLGFQQFHFGFGFFF